MGLGHHKRSEDFVYTWIDPSNLNRLVPGNYGGVEQNFGCIRQADIVNWAWGRYIKLS